MTVLPRGRPRDEAGSLPLALLASIIVAGIIVVLVVRIVATQSQVRFDQGFHASLPVADSGVNLGKFWLNNGTELEGEAGTTGDEGELCDDPLLQEPANFPVGCKTKEYQRQIDGNEYTFTMFRESERDWVIDSVGVDTQSGESRRVVGTISERPLIETALFADSLINFAGSNWADSYSSESGVWCTGRGFVATNRDLTTSGTAGGPCHTQYGLNRTIDRGFLHDVASEEGEIHNDTETYPGGDRCVHDGGGGGANCREVSAENPEYLAPDLFDDPLELSLEENVAFIQEALDACGSPDPDPAVEPWNMTEYNTSDGSDHDDGLQPGRLQRGGFEPDGIDFPGDISGPYRCVNNLVFDVDTEISASTKEPVILVVRNFLSIQGGGVNSATHVGCFENGDTRCVAGPGDGASSPEAARLWIFVADEAEVDIGNHSAFAGVIWGPGAVCDGGAQAEIFGSLICGTLPHNLGSWKFHYDEALGDVSSGEFYRSAWREEFLD